MEVLDIVRRTIRRHDLAAPGTRVVVALSGGGDSVALARLLRELDAARETVVAGVAHFNHQLREHADGDEAFCRAFAEGCGWPFLADREDVRARAASEHRSIEDAARTARHAFFERARVHFAADVVAVGHTRDDQAETFLLRLLRGAGPRGLSSMHPRNGRVIRPLLDCRRAELRAYLDARGVQYVEDETNADVSIPRNRVRAELLPLLESRFNPSVVDVLADQAELAREDWNWMLETVKATNPEPGTRNLELAALLALPRALRRLTVWRAMTQAAEGRTVSLHHVDAVLDLIESPGTGGSIDAPGHFVERVGVRVVLRSGRADDARAADAADFFRYPLSIPGEVLVVEHGCVVSAELAAAEAARRAIRAVVGNGVAGKKVSNPATAVVAADGWAAPLAVRNRRPGDRFQPFGLDGQKKLQDFLVDRKVARAERDRVPLVVDENDRILWVAGHEIDEAFRVTDASQAVLILTLRQA